MAKHKPLTRAQVDAFLDELLVDADNEEMQLTAIEQEMSDAVQSVAEVEVYVLGELMSLVAVNFDGNVRRGLIARCRRDDGRECRISLLDVAIPPQSEIHRYLAAYCRWCGVKPLAVESSAVANKSGPKARQEDIDLTKPVELIVLRVMERAARCRLLTNSRINDLACPRLLAKRAGSVGHGGAKQALDSFRTSVFVRQDQRTAYRCCQTAARTVVIV